MAGKRKIETNVIYCGDNLDVMRNLPSESIDLIYIDPPFFSNRVYETIWGDKQDTASFNDRWKGGINHYCEWMRPRLEQMHRLLKETGTFYCHLDWHAVHYIKTILDEIFGRDFFINEIVWKRQSSHNDSKQGSSHLGRIHDSILMYSKSKKYTFNMQYLPYSEDYIKKAYRHVDSNGRKYRLDNLTGPGGKSKGNAHYEVMGVKRYWRYTKEKMNKLIKEGRVIQTKPGRVPAYKRFLDEMPGVPIGSVWTDINVVQSNSKERVGYPTQKPEALLERIIQLSSNKDDIIADFFCGCGTSLVAAHNLKRRYLGVDNSKNASKIVRKRLKSIGVDLTELAIKSLTKAQILKLKPFDFEEYVVRCIGGEPNKKKVGDGGVDGRLIEDGTPIQVKKSRSIGRPVIDSFYKHLEINGRGVVIALSFGKGAYEEVAKLKREGYDIELVTLQEILDLSLHKEASKLQRSKPRKKVKKKVAKRKKKVS